MSEGDMNNAEDQNVDPSEHAAAIGNKKFWGIEWNRTRILVLVLITAIVALVIALAVVSVKDDSDSHPLYWNSIGNEISVETLYTPTEGGKQSVSLSADGKVVAIGFKDSFLNRYKVRVYALRREG